MREIELEKVNTHIENISDMEDVKYVLKLIWAVIINFYMDMDEADRMNAKLKALTDKYHKDMERIVFGGGEQ